MPLSFTTAPCPRPPLQVEVVEPKKQIVEKDEKIAKAAADKAPGHDPSPNPNPNPSVTTTHPTLTLTPTLTRRYTPSYVSQLRQSN